MMASRSTRATALPSSASRQPRTLPTASTTVSASTNSTSEAENAARIVGPTCVQATSIGFRALLAESADQGRMFPAAAPPQFCHRGTVAAKPHYRSGFRLSGESSMRRIGRESRAHQQGNHRTIMAKAETASTRLPRGTKPVAQAFLAALDSVPEMSRAAVAKAAQAMIRDELKARREKERANRVGPHGADARRKPLPAGRRSRRPPPRRRAGRGGDLILPTRWRGRSAHHRRGRSRPGSRCRPASAAPRPGTR